MTHVEVCRRLETLIEQHGSLCKAAEALKVTPAALSFVLTGKRAVGPKFQRALGLRRVVTKTFTYEVQRG
ncbi:MAG: helix-turn-helix domain-containing protein [Gemmatimonadaceae bacterium]|nr:helix-turn-helix domain-containing protein [Gemmatimonadaceae bacterium]